MFNGKDDVWKAMYGTLFAADKKGVGCDLVGSTHNYLLETIRSEAFLFVMPYTSS